MYVDDLMWANLCSQDPNRNTISMNKAKLKKQDYTRKFLTIGTTGPEDMYFIRPGKNFLSFSSS